MGEPICCCICCIVVTLLVVLVAEFTLGAFASDGSSPGHAVGGGGASRGGLPSEQALQSLALLNQLRADGFTCPGGEEFRPNAVPLQLDCALFRAAQRHSEDMAQNGFLSNWSPSGLSPQDRAEKEGSPATGENVARGQSQAYQALAAWKASEGACTNMMDPNHKLAAVGYAAGAGDGGGGFLASTAGHPGYWTQMLADSSMPADQSCAPSDMHLFGRSSADPQEPLVGKVGKTWRVGDAPPAGSVSTTNPSGGFKFAVGQ